MTIRALLAYGITALVLVCLSPHCVAQPFTTDDTLKPFKLTLRDYPDGNGVLWTSASGVSGTATDYLYVKPISARRAIEAHVISLSEDADVSMVVVKDTWDENLQNCRTDSSGMCGVRFRALGDAGFKISAPDGTQWQLVIFAGPEIPMDALMPSPLFEAERADAARYEANAAADDSDSGSWLGITAVALLAAIVVLLLRNRRASTTTVLIALLLLISPYQQSYAISESTSGTLDALNDELSDAESRNSRRDAMRNRIDSNVQLLQSRLAILMDLHNAIDAWTDLTDIGKCSNISNPAGAPRVPMFCEGDAGCEACYADARREFNHVRGVFEQLRTIYQCNKKAIDAAIAFGDSASGVHAVSGLAWQAQRVRIEASVTDLNNAYDAKHTELLGRLHASMIDIAMCEAQYGEPDWYDRFGFVYFEFIGDKYRR